MPSKLEYRAPVEKPAMEAISSTEAPWKPLLAKTRRAAASRRSRVCALRCSRVMREGGDSAGGGSAAGGDAGVTAGLRGV